MFYFAYEAEGRGLEGTPLMIAITAGNTGEVYRSGGRNMFSMSDLLSPLRATAHRCGLEWGEPFVLYQADKLSPEEIESATVEQNRRSGLGVVQDELDQRPGCG
jgi:glutathione-regulated potassium-efflux system ancillary protein KefG